jgi:hypothetical protein
MLGIGNNPMLSTTNRGHIMDESRKVSIKLNPQHVMIKSFDDNITDQELEARYLEVLKRFQDEIRKIKGSIARKAPPLDYFYNLSVKGKKPENMKLVCITDFFLNLKPADGKRYIAVKYNNYILNEDADIPSAMFIESKDFLDYGIKSGFIDEPQVAKVPKKHAFILKEFLKEEGANLV